HDVAAGRITLDGHDVRDVTQASLRAQMGIVTQENFLFSDTIRYNIAYGKPDATPAEIERAARQAHAHDFILACPEGYDTLVDEQGQVHYAGSREQVPEQYRPQLPPAEPAAPGASTPAAPGASTPEASGRPPTLLAGECMLLIPGGTRRPHDSRSYPNCDECR